MKLLKRTPEEEFNLLEKQIGKEIFVTAFHYGLINPITVKDKLAEVIPYEEIKTKPSAVSTGHMTFLGPIGGISSIKDENGNLLYECAEVVEMVRKDNEVKRIHYANSYRRRKFGSGHDLPVLAEDEFDLLNKYIGEKIEISILTYGAEPYTDTGTLERFARFIGLWVRENNFVESGYAFINPRGGILSIKDRAGDTIYECLQMHNVLKEGTTHEERIDLANLCRDEKFGPGHRLKSSKK